MKFTKIVATVNASTCTRELLLALYKNGMDVVRFNTAHMEIPDLERAVALVRGVSDKIAIMVDTKGPNIRTGNVDAPLPLAKGERIGVTGSPASAGPRVVLVNYPPFAEEVPAGARIVCDDGALELLVRGRKDSVLECEAAREGVLKNHKSINVPDVELNAETLTEKDRRFIDYVVRHEIDYIAHSFVRNAEDVAAVRALLDAGNSPCRIIAKIENRQGVRNIAGILKAADGIMVARGDLGIEIPLEEVPLIQKELIRSARKAGKPVITATQMLQSMEESPLPTRAEVNDVANAVYDGTDAVMLSGETAQGRYPVEAVSMMTRIVEEAEKSSRSFFNQIDVVDTDGDREYDFVIRAAVGAAEALDLRAIVCNTGEGKSARCCAAYRPLVPIYAFSYRKHVVRQLALVYGVYAEYNAFVEEMLELGHETARRLIDGKRLRPEEKIVMLSKNSPARETNNLICLGEVREFI
ncbi:pyruvate kinase [uncultured Victivallis sp.]|uniref:pyruvate kinase n=1 Tax=uncultured Victivallis sp. TaxID=354118 RepID=UPI0025E9D110|nr:pyruvate kinase [uncultured Victivallis sp.]